MGRGVEQNKWNFSWKTLVDGSRRFPEIENEEIVNFVGVIIYSVHTFSLHQFAKGVAPTHQVSIKVEKFVSRCWANLEKENVFFERISNWHYMTQRKIHFAFDAVARNLVLARRLPLLTCRCATSQ